MLLVFLASVLAHLFIIQWARDSFILISPFEDEQDVIKVTLQTTTATEKQKTRPDRLLPAITASETSSPRSPDAQETTTARATTEAAVQVDATPEPATSSAPMTKAVDAVNETTLEAVAAPPPEPSPVKNHALPEPTPQQRHASPEPVTEPTPAPQEPSTAQTRAPHEPTPSQTNAPPADPVTASDATSLLSRISLPPSANLSYDAVAIKGSSKVEGRGLVKWVQDGRQYSIAGEASVLFLSLLSYRSEGRLSEAGILPELYTEKRVGKSSTNTHFHRERQTISFSASTNSYPVKGGEQDRGSVFWQLAGLARGNPDKLKAGLSFELIIAGSRTVDPWRVTVQGTEPIALGQGQTDAWHMSLVRPDGGTDYQLEVWIAPVQDWYPVKIMYVDRKGTSLGLTLSKLEKK